MKVALRIALTVVSFMAVSSCKADEIFSNIRYDVTSYDRWPVIVFLDIDGVPQHRAFHPDAMARNSGYGEPIASIPARNIQWSADKPGVLDINVTWYERVTEAAYSASISVNSRDLRPDPVQPEFGTLVLRIAGGGDLQAVTFEQNLERDEHPAKAIVLAQVCAEQIDISDPDQLMDLQRMLEDPMISSGMVGHAKPEEIPSNCN